MTGKTNGNVRPLARAYAALVLRAFDGVFPRSSRSRTAAGDLHVVRSPLRLPLRARQRDDGVRGMQRRVRLILF
jgi:hypothetical protein